VALNRVVAKRQNENGYLQRLSTTVNNPGVIESSLENTGLVFLFPLQLSSYFMKSYMRQNESKLHQIF
jgi:hypothetical protein